MLSRDKLVEFYQGLRETNVLSVYLNAEAHDPAERTAWARGLERRLKEERARIESDLPEQLSDFDAASERILGELEAYPAFLPGRGWVAFATADEVQYAESVPVSMPDLVRWEAGIRVAPYVRGLKQERAVVAALTDSRKARVFTYRDGDLVEEVDLVADTSIGDLSESASSKRGRGVEMPQRAGTHSGTRGQTGTDAAQRALEESASRLHAMVVEKLEELAGSSGFVVLGGTPEVVAALAQRMGSMGERVLARPSLHLGMSKAELKSAVEDAASELTRHDQERLLDSVIDLARSGGKGCLGDEATEGALRERRVETLLISRALRERQSDQVDRWVGAAFEQVR